MFLGIMQIHTQNFLEIMLSIKTNKQIFTQNNAIKQQLIAFRSGVILTRHYVHSSCSPSRAALLTGWNKWEFRHDARHCISWHVTNHRSRIWHLICLLIGRYAWRMGMQRGNIGRYQPLGNSHAPFAPWKLWLFVWIILKALWKLLQC